LPSSWSASPINHRAQRINKLINQLQFSKYNATISRFLTCSTDKSHFHAFSYYSDDYRKCVYWTISPTDGGGDYIRLQVLDVRWQVIQMALHGCWWISASPEPILVIPQSCCVSCSRGRQLDVFWLVWMPYGMSISW
jgi:hypothetical protein